MMGPPLAGVYRQNSGPQDDGCASDCAVSDDVLSHELAPDKTESAFDATLDGETVGLEEIDDGIWSLFCGVTLLARFDERDRRFYG